MQAINKLIEVSLLHVVTFLLYQGKTGFKEGVSTPGASDGKGIILIVVILIAVTKTLYLRIVAIVLRGRPVPAAKKQPTFRWRSYGQKHRFFYISAFGASLLK